jgi:hypothetical protein
VHAFRGNSDQEKLPWKFPRREEKFGSRPCGIEGKTSPNLHTKNGFHANSDCECSACSNSLFTDINHPCLLHLKPATASSCLRPLRPWPPSCPTPPLPPPVVCVPGAPSRPLHVLHCRRCHRHPAAAATPARSGDFAPF